MAEGQFSRIAANETNRFIDKDGVSTEFQKGDTVEVDYNFYLGFPEYSPNTGEDYPVDLREFTGFFSQSFLEFGRPCFNDLVMNPVRELALWEATHNKASKHIFDKVEARSTDLRAVTIETNPMFEDSENKTKISESPNKVPSKRNALVRRCAERYKETKLGQQTKLMYVKSFCHFYIHSTFKSSDLEAVEERASLALTHGLENEVAFDTRMEHQDYLNNQPVELPSTKAW